MFEELLCKATVIGSIKSLLNHRPTNRSVKRASLKIAVAGVEQSREFSFLGGKENSCGFVINAAVLVKPIPAKVQPRLEVQAKGGARCGGPGVWKDEISRVSYGCKL